MSLIQSAKINGRDPYAYLKDVLAWLPTQKNNAIEELLPHSWKLAVTVGEGGDRRMLTNIGSCSKAG